MKIEVVTTKVFDLNESNGKNDYARHLANNGVRTVKAGVEVKMEQTSVPQPNDADGNPVAPLSVVLPTPYVNLVDTASGKTISETRSDSPDVAEAMKIYSAMPEYLARIWTSRESEKKPSAGGTGKRGRKSNEERARLAAEAAAANGAPPVPQTAEEILQNAIAAQNAKEEGKKAKAGKS